MTGYNWTDAELEIIITEERDSFRKSFERALPVARACGATKAELVGTLLRLRKRGIPKGSCISYMPDCDTRESQ